MQCISKVYLFVKMKVSDEILTTETYSNAIHDLRFFTFRNIHVLRTFWFWNEWTFKYVLLLIFVQQLQKPILTFFRRIKLDLVAVCILYYSTGIGGKHGYSIFWSEYWLMSKYVFRLDLLKYTLFGTCPKGLTGKPNGDIKRKGK